MMSENISSFMRPERTQLLKNELSRALSFDLSDTSFNRSSSIYSTTVHSVYFLPVSCAVSRQTGERNSTNVNCFISTKSKSRMKNIVTYQAKEIINKESWSPPSLVFNPDALEDYIQQNSGTIDKDLLDLDSGVEGNITTDSFGSYEYSQSFSGVPKSKKEDLVFRKLYQQPVYDVTHNNINLTSDKLLQCNEIWSLSSIFRWLLNLSIWFKQTHFYENDLVNSLSMLLNFYYPNMGEAETLELVDVILEECNNSGGLIFHFNNQVLINETATVGGVIPQLTTCYSSHYNHDDKFSADYNCYDMACRRLSKPELIALDGSLGRSWIEHWNIGELESNALDKETIDRNSAIFELISAAYRNVKNHIEFVEKVGKDFLRQSELVTHPIKKKQFYQIAFGAVKEICKSKQKYLLAPLREILALQGKFITKDYWNPFLNWLDNNSEAYEKEVANNSVLSSFINFEKKRPSSKFFQWYDSHSAINARKHFSNFFVDDAITPLAAFDKLWKLSPVDSIERAQLDKVRTKLKAFAEQLNIWRKTYDTQERIKSIVFAPGVASIRFTKESTIEFENYVKKRSGDVVDHYILLFNHTLLVCQPDYITHKFIVIKDPIPIQYLYLMRCSKNNSAQERKSHRLSFISSSADKGSSNMSEIRLFDFSKGIVILIFVGKSQDLLWADRITEVKAAFKKNLEPTSIFKLKYTAEDSSSLDFLNYYTRGYNPEIPSGKKGQGVQAYALNSAILSSITINYKGKTYIIAGLNNGVLIRHNLKLHFWHKVLSYENVSQIGYLHEKHLLVLLSSKKLVCLRIKELVACLGKDNTTKLRPGFISKDVVDFAISSYGNHSEALLYIKMNSVRVARISIEYSRFTEKPIASLGLTEDYKAERCALVNSRIFLIMKNTRVYRLTITPKKTLLARFPFMVDSMLAGAHDLERAIDSYDNSLLRSADRLKASTPVTVFGMASGETLIIYKRLAVFCNDKGFFSRAEFIEFDILCEGAAYRHGHLVVAGGNGIEIYKVHDTGPKAAELAQVVTGENIRLVDYKDSSSLVKLISADPESKVKTQHFMELSGTKQ